MNLANRRSVGANVIIFQGSKKMSIFEPRKAEIQLKAAFRKSVTMRLESVPLALCSDDRRPPSRLFPWCQRAGVCRLRGTKGARPSIVGAGRRSGGGRGVPPGRGAASL